MLPDRAPPDFGEVDQAGQREGDRHEIDEGSVDEAQDVGGVAIGPDTIGLEPGEPRQQEQERRVGRLHDALEPALGAGAQHTVDEVHDGVLVGERHQGQPREDQHDQHELGDLEGATHRAAEDVARHHVDRGEHHHGEEDGGRGGTEERIGAPRPLRAGRAHLPAATFFSSSWNSVRVLAASTPLARAFVIQSSMIGAERFFTSATKAGLALTILTPDFFSASIPFWSASSHDLPARRAMCSPEIFSIASWSALGSLFHLSSFMKKPKAELYIPPGKSVACSSTVSSLNEMIDSIGKKTPSATPDFSNSYDSGAGFTKAEAPRAFATASATPPPVRIFRPCTSPIPLTDRLVNIWPGPCVNTPSSFTPLYSPTL